MVTGKGYSDRFINPSEVEEVVDSGLKSMQLDQRRVLVIIPDGTRTMPMGLMFGYFQKYLVHRVAQLDFLVALGTHQPMTKAQLSRLVGQPVINGQVGKSHIYNHMWSDPATFTTIGTIPASEISEISNGLMSQDVLVTLNKMIMDYDQIIICGPVFPHEVVGFSGGNKYFFPGIGGPEIINFTHWLGAVMTSFRIIGTAKTPVRAVIDRAARFINKPKSCFALVVTQEGLSGIYFGMPEEAWSAAADLSAQKHITYVDRPYQRVLAIMPEMYDDLWTAAKGMYKLEPVVADGGELVIYAPHVKEVSYTHGKILDQIGYHCRDYFLAQWDKFKSFPWGVLAHSTHVKGMGQYNAVTGVETPRVRVTLATGIPEQRCQRINLSFLDPGAIHVADWQNRESEGILVVPHAGEMLFRLHSDKD